MAFYEITRDCLREIPNTTFAVAGIRERDDLQRLLRNMKPRSHRISVGNLRPRL